MSIAKKEGPEAKTPMESERPKHITGHHNHFIENYAKYRHRWEIADEHLQYVLDHAGDGFFERQPDGLWKFKVFVPELGYVLRAIILPDGRAYTAYRDGKATREYFERR